MPDIYSRAVQYAADIFGFDQPGKFFAKCHTHSAASIYLYTKADTEYLCKIDCSPTARSYSAMLQRFEFAEYLHQKGIHVLSPLRSPQGKIIECFHLDEGDCMLYAWTKIPGQVLSDIDPMDLRDFYQDWAKLLADIHRLTKEYPNTATLKQDHNPDYLYWHQEWEDVYNALREPQMRNLWQDIKEELDLFPISIDNFGMIHNDVHSQNLLITDSGLHLIDFDRSTRHFFVQDIANAIYSEYSRIAYHSNHKSRLPMLDKLFLQPFISTYLEHYPLENHEFERIESFILYRRILMYSIFQEELESQSPKIKKKLAQDIIHRTPFLQRSINDLLEL